MVKPLLGIEIWKSSIYMVKPLLGIEKLYGQTITGYRNLDIFFIYGQTITGYRNLDIFFKDYMVKPLLGIEKIEFCEICEKVLFKMEEKPWGSICCERCGCSFHLKCENIKNPEENELFCGNCVISMASDME